MTSLLVFNLTTLSHRWLNPAWEDRLDGLAGFFLGAAIVLILRFVWLRGRLLRGQDIPPCA